MAEGQPFKVIIAGGSVAGLALANALEQAGIDYVLLEKRQVAPDVGASISVLCHISKVFDQLGVWRTMQNATLPLLDRQHFDKNGRLFEDTTVLRLIAEKTKRPFVFMERRFYLETLYDNIKDKTKVHANAGIVSYEQIETGVKVTTDKGETIEGGILVGADGIHSTVRGLMADAISKTDPVKFKQLTEGFTATYRTVFATSHNYHKGDTTKPLIPGGTVQNVYYRNVSGVIAAGVEGLVFWFLFIKEDKPTHTPHCPRYTDADAEATIEKYGTLALGPGYTFRNLWDTRVKGGMVPMEEGVLQCKWNNGGRVLLLGDAVAKSTINVGLGGNTAVEGVVHFVNELVPLLKRSATPTTQDVQAMLDRFESKQRPRAKYCVTFSGLVTRFEAMDTWWLRLLRIISPWLPDRLKARGFLDFMAPAPILNFLPDPDGPRV